MKAILLALVAAGLIGCGGHAQDVLVSQPGPSPVVLKDTSAAQLAVSVAVTMGGYDPSSRDRTMIDVFLQHDGRPVNLVNGERVECGGTGLTAFNGSFETTVATSSLAGKMLSCTYTSGQQSAPFKFRVPDALVISSPQDHQKVARSSRTVVSYSGGSDPKLWVIALGTSAKAVARPDAITTTSAALDTTTLGPGDGSIAVTDPNNLPLAEVEGLQFRSVAAFARRQTMVSVVWV